MNNVMFKIGSFNIYWYSVLILLAVILGASLARKYAKGKKVGQAFISDLMFEIIPISIVGARLYYVIFNFDYYKYDILSILKIWEGGLAIYGAIIAGLLTIIIKCLKQKKSILETLDIFSASLILGQAIGRWGNFFNQEAYGGVTSLQTLTNLHIPKFIIDGMYIKNAYRTPLFLYESLWCFIGFIIILILRKQRLKNGKQIFFYFFWYGLGRFIIEYFRTDSLYIGNFKVSMIVSLILFLTGLTGFIVGLISKVKKNTKRITDATGRI